MFEVRAAFPFGDNFAENDEILKREASPFVASFSGTGACRDQASGREHGFYVQTFEEAVKLKKQLDTSGIDDIKVVIREQTTGAYVAPIMEIPPSPPW